MWKISYTRSYFCFYDSAEGANVFKALYLGAPRLIASFSFGLISLVIAGLYAYTYFSQTAIIEDESCHSPFQCVIKSVLDGFRGDLTTLLGQNNHTWSFPPMAMWKDLWFQYRTTVIVISIIFYNMFLQPVYAGLILDSFTQLRNLYKACATELENKCLITGLEKEVFDDYGGEWDARKEGEYALRYFLFLKYLLDKDPGDYTGLENDVMDSAKEGDHDFLPVGTFFAKLQRERESKAEKEAEKDKSPADAEQQDKPIRQAILKTEVELLNLKKQHEETQKTLETLVQMLSGRSVDFEVDTTSPTPELFTGTPFRRIHSKDFFDSVV